MPRRGIQVTVPVVKLSLVPSKVVTIVVVVIVPAIVSVLLKLLVLQRKRSN